MRHFLGDARGLLRQMVRLVNVREQLLGTLAAVGDLSYAFDVISDYVPLMHALIKKDPFAVLLLRATFVKLASVLELPLVRINQAGSADLESVAEYYSAQLVAFVRRVLAVVPDNVFRILTDIVAVQTRAALAMPARIESAELKDYAQMAERYRLARSTHRVSVFTEGVLAMEKTLVGVIEVDPKQLLQEGIRKELVRQITMALHNTLVFPPAPAGKPGAFDSTLLVLDHLLAGYRQSFEYISDYLSLDGLKIWHEELARIISFHVQQECNAFHKKKIYDWQSEFQSEAIPIPVHPPLDGYSTTFVGRLVRELLQRTERVSTRYVDAKSAWVDGGGKELVGMRTMTLLHRSIGATGLRGIDRTLASLIVRDLHDVVRFYKERVLAKAQSALQQMEAEFTPTSTLPALADRMYKSALQKWANLWPWLADGLSRVGQVQLLRRQLGAELNFASKLDSPTLAHALGVLNDAVLADVAAHYRDPESHPYPSEAKGLLPLLAPYLDSIGMTCPLQKVYIAAEPPECLACVLALVVLSQAPLYKLAGKAGLEPLPKTGAPDGTTLVVGVLTLLKQFHRAVTHKFIAYLAQCIRCQVVPPAQRVPAHM